MESRLGCPADPQLTPALHRPQTAWGTLGPQPRAALSAPPVASRPGPSPGSSGTHRIPDNVSLSLKLFLNSSDSNLEISEDALCRKPPRTGGGHSTGARRPSLLSFWVTLTLWSVSSPRLCVSWVFVPCRLQGLRLQTLPSRHSVSSTGSATGLLASLLRPRVPCPLLQ